MGIPSQEHPSKLQQAYSPTANKRSGDPGAPKVPPRMQKQGPELPEKPPHMRLTSLTSKLSMPSSQSEFSAADASERSQQLFLNNVRKKSAAADREVLVAATKSFRDRPVEKRQREPAKLLVPTAKAGQRSAPNDSLRVLLGLSSPTLQRKKNPPVQKADAYRPSQPSKMIHLSQKTNSKQPVILIPRSQLDTRSLQHLWSSYPISYSLWVQNSGSGDAQVTSRLVKKAFCPNGSSTVDLRPGVVLKSRSKGPKDQLETKIFVSSKNTYPSSSTSAKPRSSSVTRSGSLTSHGSTSSDSGNEAIPKSVLKKQKWEEDANTLNNNNNNNKKNTEQKKNVTFNAFATVQLMDE